MAEDTKVPVVSEIDLELQKAGATAAKFLNGALNFLANVGGAIAANLEPMLERIATAVATYYIDKILAKNGIKTE